MAAAGALLLLLLLRRCPSAPAQPAPLGSAWHARAFRVVEARLALQPSAIGGPQARPQVHMELSLYPALLRTSARTSPPPPPPHPTAPHPCPATTAVAEEKEREAKKQGVVVPSAARHQMAVMHALQGLREQVAVRGRRLSPSVVTALFQSITHCGRGSQTPCTTRRQGAKILY